MSSIGNSSTSNSDTENPTQKVIRRQAISMERVGADLVAMELMWQLFSQGSTIEQRAHIVLNTILHADEAGEKCNELVAIANRFAEDETL